MCVAGTLFVFARESACEHFAAGQKCVCQIKERTVSYVDK